MSSRNSTPSVTYSATPSPHPPCLLPLKSLHPSNGALQSQDSPEQVSVMSWITNLWDWAKPLSSSSLSFILCALMQKQDLFALLYQLFSLFSASADDSQMVRDEPFLLALPAQSVMPSAVPCPHCHAMPLFTCSSCATPSLLCHAPDCHAPGCSHSLEAFKSPSAPLSSYLAHCCGLSGCGKARACCFSS